MKTNDTKWIRELGVCVSVLFLTTDFLSAGIVDNTEPTNWVNGMTYGSVTVSNGASGLVSVSFKEQNPNSPSAATGVEVVAGGDPAGSPFAGNYFAAGVSHIAFEIRANVVTNAKVFAVLNGGSSGLTWTKPLTPPSTVGVWVTNIVSVGSMDGWKYASAPDAVQLWSNDIRNVQFVGVKLIPAGIGAQTFEIRSFILVGPDFASAPALLVLIGDALKERFGVRSISLLTAEQKAQDLDKDGVTDLDEILTGTNPDNPNSVFAAEIVGVSAQGVKIRWPCVEGNVYTVSRTSDLVAKTGFEALMQGYRLTATSTGYMEFTDTTTETDGGPYFYRIVKE